MLFPNPARLPRDRRLLLIVPTLILLGMLDRTVYAARPNTPQTPWVGEAGVTETTQQIMDRSPDYVRPPKLPFRAAKKHPLGRIDDDNLRSAPASLDVARVGDPTNGVPLVADAQSTGLNFTAVTVNDTQAVPPDSMGAVGPSQVIVAVNGRIRSFNKTTGVADGVLNVNPDVFFNSVLTPPTTDNFTSDPRIRYDQLSGRWFLLIIDVPGQTGTNPNRILIAISDSGVITSNTTWTFFQFQHDLPTPTSNKDTGKFADYPTLGIDAHALYIGVNLFGTRGVGSFASTTAFVVRKSSLLTGGPIVVTPFRGLTANNPNASGPYTPQGVDNPDPNATEGYFIGVASALLGQLVLERISDPGGNPSISEVSLSVPLTSQPIDVPHLGNNNGANGRLDGLDRRLLMARIRNGRLWTCSNIGVDNTGAAGGPATRTGIRWYELDGIESGQTPTVVQSGTLFHPAASNTTDQRNYWMGSLAVSGQGHALMGFSVAGENERANAGYAGRLAGDPLGTLRTPVVFTASGAAYNPSFDPGGPSGRRWGDYSFTVVDPDDDMSMWTFQEWCHAPNAYAVQVLKVLAPPPAMPIAAVPAAIDAGQSNLVVTLTGHVTDGSGFFDPGPGFANRIGATVNGGGVSVNDVTYNNPTNITLNLSVANDAPGGLRSLTVTNPDGQSRTSTGGLLTIIAVVPTNNPPAWVDPGHQVVDEETLLSFTAHATDPDGDRLTFTLDPNAPVGAAINPTNGLFTWTPTESQGPSSNQVSLVASDDGAPGLAATQTIAIVVNEVNLPPQLNGIADRTLHAGMSITLSNAAADLDVPANTLTYSLDPGNPPGSFIDPVTGVLTWTTDASHIGTTNVFTVRVTDNGQPPSDHTTTFVTTVNGPPLIQSIATDQEQIILNWSSIPGITYDLQYWSGAAGDPWVDLPPSVAATNILSTGLDAFATNAVRLYRVRTTN